MTGVGSYSYACARSPGFVRALRKALSAPAQCTWHTLPAAHELHSPHAACAPRPHRTHLCVQSAHDGVEAGRELEVVELLVLLADRVLGVDLGALCVALLNGLFHLSVQGGEVSVQAVSMVARAEKRAEAEAPDK